MNFTQQRVNVSERRKVVISCKELFLVVWKSLKEQRYRDIEQEYCNIQLRKSSPYDENKKVHVRL